MNNSITLKIEGMTCNHCVKHVLEALWEVNGVIKAEVSLESGSAVVRGEVAPGALLKAIEDAGYTARVA